MRSLVCCLTAIVALAILHSATAMESYESVPPEIEKRMEEERPSGVKQRLESLENEEDEQ